MGLRDTRLPCWSCWRGHHRRRRGVLMQWWMNAVDYPLIISGKPLFSLPANIPVTFELTVLFGAITRLRRDVRASTTCPSSTTRSSAASGSARVTDRPVLHHHRGRRTRSSTRSGPRALLALGGRRPRRTAGGVSRCRRWVIPGAVAARARWRWSRWRCIARARAVEVAPAARPPVPTWTTRPSSRPAAQRAVRRRPGDAPAGRRAPWPAGRLRTDDRSRPRAVERRGLRRRASRWTSTERAAGPRAASASTSSARPATAWPGYGDGMVARRAERLQQGDLGARRRRCTSSRPARGRWATVQHDHATGSAPCRPTARRSRSRTAGRSWPTSGRCSGARTPRIDDVPPRQRSESAISGGRDE